MNILLFRFIAVSILLCIIGAKENGERNDPLHFAMQKEYQLATDQKEVFSFSGLDSLGEHAMFLLYTGDHNPLLYYSNIVTPVCIDNVCKPMYIQIYWNLVGEYVGYGVVEDNLLSKFDHDLFEPRDYRKLHDLLLDKHSILERRKLSDLFDPGKKPEKAIEFNGEEVDALSGATKKEISESVVEGALYSCYTAWHLVHGTVVKKMVNHIDSLYNAHLANYFISSPYIAYQRYALQRFSETEYINQLPRIIEILKSSKPLLRTYVLKKLPDLAWAKGDILKLYEGFSNLDTNSKTLLIKNLSLADDSALMHVAGGITGVTKNQLRTFLEFLAEKPTRLTEDMLALLHAAAENQTYAHNYLIAEFLER
ncbi:MAG: hypothetical protein HKN87_16155 [Saprospiraceae bacterium]|nr:hypothetical protein [Saprospiraceae bacterium]